MSMHVGCKCNVVIATCPQHYLESTFLSCHNVVITTLSQPKDNIVTTLSQRDFVCWDIGFRKYSHHVCHKGKHIEKNIYTICSD